MLFVYRILINLLLVLSPIIIVFRIINNKEHPKRFLEKIGFITKKKKNNENLIWFHGSSVGEILSVIPLIEKLEKKKKIKEILLTSNTLSSSKVIKKFNLKKTTHQFFPLDTNFITKKFLDYWKPKMAIFIESEIWPNIILNIKKKNIPLILLNARITKKSFNRWNKIINFSKFIFNKFNLCLVQNDETKNYLKKLGAKNIKKIGNLKFSETSNKSISKDNYHQLNFLKSKKILFSAVSTHQSEEMFCAKIYKKLSTKHKKSIVIIIPRHIDRSSEIKNDLENLGLCIHRHSSKKKINKNTNVYLVDTYGETESFLKKCGIVFLGGSLISHGGQNPLEAARLGCRVLHGPHISNFLEVYKLLNKIKIAKKIKKIPEAINEINKHLNNKNNTTKIQKKLKLIGNQTLSKNQTEIEKYL